MTPEQLNREWQRYNNSLRHIRGILSLLSEQKPSKQLVDAIHELDQKLSSTGTALQNYEDMSSKDLGVRY